MKLVLSRCVISLKTSSKRDVFQLTGRKATLTICIRAKECPEQRKLQELVLIEQVMKVLVRVVEGLIRQIVETEEMECGLCQKLVLLI